MSAWSINCISQPVIRQISYINQKEYKKTEPRLLSQHHTTRKQELWVAIQLHTGTPVLIKFTILT